MTGRACTCLLPSRNPVELRNACRALERGVLLILAGGVLLFIWLSIKVSDMGEHGARTIAWSLLAVVYFGFGLGLRERWYRLMGLGTLAIALVSLVPIFWQMSTTTKIVSFFVMGGVFLGLGFVYTRYHEQLKKLL